MREVAWVIFDEIHYMRDTGILYILFFFSNLCNFSPKTISFSFEELSFIFPCKVCHLFV